MTTASPRLAAVTVYQWRLNDSSKWRFSCYVCDVLMEHMLRAVAIVGQARAWEFRNKSVAELRREGWVR